jgi:hypothetical protein
MSNAFSRHWTICGPPVPFHRFDRCRPDVVCAGSPELTGDGAFARLGDEMAVQHVQGPARQRRAQPLAPSALPIPGWRANGSASTSTSRRARTLRSGSRWAAAVDRLESHSSTWTRSSTPGPHSGTTRSVSRYESERRNILGRPYIVLDAETDWHIVTNMVPKL